MPPKTSATMFKADAENIRNALITLQANILAQLEALDGTAFVHEKPPPSCTLENHNGRICLIEEGRIFERGNIIFTDLSSPSLPSTVSNYQPELAGQPFQTIGLSLVLFPRNPYCPAAQMSLRFFHVCPSAAESVWWFAGNMLLIPYYPFEDDVRHFHRTCKNTILPLGGEVRYRHFKKWCDEYFYLPHRKEAHGAGGLFFDDLGASGQVPFKLASRLALSIVESFNSAYLPIISLRRNQPYGARERDFQALRRSRHAEFNLLYNRDLHFLLQLDDLSRDTAFLAMPPSAVWRHDWKAEPESAETLINTFLTPRDWTV